MLCLSGGGGSRPIFVNFEFFQRGSDKSSFSIVPRMILILIIIIVNNILLYFVPQQNDSYFFFVGVGG